MRTKRKPNYYGILGLGPDATQAQIKKNYRKRARVVNTDKGVNSDKEAMQLLNRAYAKLSDPKKRKQYDRKYFLRNTDNNGRHANQYKEPTDWNAYFLQTKPSDWCPPPVWKTGKETDRIVSEAEDISTKLLKNDRFWHAYHNCKAYREYKQKYPLHEALRNPDLSSDEKITQINQHKSHINKPDPFGYKPLHIAICGIYTRTVKSRRTYRSIVHPLFYHRDYTPDSHVVEHLLKSGGDKDINAKFGQDDDAFTNFIYRSSFCINMYNPHLSLKKKLKDALKILKLLIHYGINVSTLSNNAWNVLISASLPNGETTKNKTTKLKFFNIMVKLLIDQFSKANTLNKLSRIIWNEGFSTQCTRLHVIHKFNEPELILYAFQRGANPKIESSTGKIPLDLVKKYPSPYRTEYVGYIEYVGYVAFYASQNKQFIAKPLKHPPRLLSKIVNVMTGFFIGPFLDLILSIQQVINAIFVTLPKALKGQLVKGPFRREHFWWNTLVPNWLLWHVVLLPYQIIRLVVSLIISPFAGAYRSYQLTTRYGFKQAVKPNMQYWYWIAHGIASNKVSRCALNQHYATLTYRRLVPEDVLIAVSLILGVMGFALTYTGGIPALSTFLLSLGLIGTTSIGVSVLVGGTTFLLGCLITYFTYLIRSEINRPPSIIVIDDDASSTKNPYNQLNTDKRNINSHHPSTQTRKNARNTEEKQHKRTEQVSKRSTRPDTANDTSKNQKEKTTKTPSL